MLYNPLMIVILLGWILSGVYTLSYVARNYEEEDTPRKKRLHFFALFLGPVVLPLLYLKFKAQDLADLAAEKREERETAKLEAGLAPADANAPVLCDLSGTPVEPTGANVSAHESLRQLTTLAGEALTAGASQISVVPDSEGEYDLFRRIGAHEEKTAHLDLLAGGKVISTIKHAADMVKGNSVSGGFLLRQGKKSTLCRVIAVRAAGVERLVVKLGELPAPPPPEKLGLTPEQLEQLNALLNAPNGLILLCGKVGGGRTTTYYSLLNSKELSGKKIISIENTAEFQLNSVEQQEIDPKGGRSALKLLNNAVNESPDVLALGFTPDADSIRLAVNSARNGKLVIMLFDSATLQEAFDRLGRAEVTLKMLGQMPLLFLNQTLLERKAPKRGEAALVAIFDTLGGGELVKVLNQDGVTVVMLREAFGPALDNRSFTDQIRAAESAGLIPSEEAERAVAVLAPGQPRRT